MGAKYQPYPEYKNSGFEWLGDIPVDWSLSRYKFISRFQKGKNPSVLLDEPNEESVKYLSMDYLRGNADALYAEAENNSYVCSEGQILIIWDGSNAGEFVKGEKGIVSSTMAASELLVDIDHSFYWYLCVCLEPEMRRHAKGMGIPHVNGNELKDSFFPLPSILEQEKIANFLDNETAKIDTLIEKQQQLIKLLREKRQAVISHAVTKGLNPNAPMRDSGVEWLGEVPEYWLLPKLIHRTYRIGDGLHSTPKYQDDTGYYFVNGNNLVNGHILVGATAKEVPEEEYKNHYVHLDKSSVLLSINGTIGNVARYDGEKIILGKSAAYMNCSGDLLPEYLMLYLQSSQALRYFDLEVTGTTIYNLSLNSIRQMKVCIPPEAEQLEIDEYCQRQKNKYDSLIEKATSAITLMQERRTALISAAVTGKIDVRNWQSPEPSDNQNKEVAA